MGTIVKNGVNYSGSGGQGTNDYDDLINQPQINGVTLSGNKTPDALGLVTKAVNDLVNYYLKSETYSKSEVDNIATTIKNSRFEVVASLPTSNIKTNVIYLVPSADPTTQNVKDEYINLDGTSAGWECIGSTSVDLSGYVTDDELNTALADYTTTTDLTALLANKQDKVQYSILPTASAELVGKIFEYTGATGGGFTHGYFYECVSDGESTPTYSWQQTNVQPNGGGGGGSYTAGDGIDITNDVISTKQSETGDIDKIVDVYPTAGNLVSIVNAFNRGDIYSTEEKMIGQWTDGKPLYAKTFDVGALPNNSYKSVSTGLTNENVKIIKGVATASWGAINLPHITKETAYNVELSYEDHSIKVGTGTDRSSMDGSVTIYYTKTTDSAISIGNDTDYSTEEKIVGTWIDGKPVYQRTVVINNPLNNWDTIQSYGIENIEHVISVNDRYWMNNNAWEGSQYYKTTDNITAIFLRSGFRLSCVGATPSKVILTIQYTKTT